MNKNLQCCHFAYRYCLRNWWLSGILCENVSGMSIFLNKKLCWIIGLTGLNVGHMGGPWGFARMGCFLMIALSANMYKCPEFCDIDFFLLR